MKQQIHYMFLQKQILLLIGLSLIPGLVYVFFAWAFDILVPSLLWYFSLMIVSLYGGYIYRKFSITKMNEKELVNWYKHLSIFMYIIFSSWSVIFAINIQHDELNLHYIAIFTQLGASVVASTLLVSDKKLFVPILLTLMLPLSFYFFILGTWFGYVLAVFSLIFVGVLLYAAYNTNRLIVTNYHQAQHDSLTGLYNRRYFMEYMESLEERLHENKKVVYLFLIDLDHFKMINDSLGHNIGDMLLIEVAQRIETYSKETHVLARLGGDEFILVSNDTVSNALAEKEAELFAKELLVKLREVFIIDKHRLHVSASIGVHKLKNFSDNANHFIKEVDIAMYEAKSKGRDGVIFFNKNLSVKVERFLAIEQKLYNALDVKDLVMHYQPQFNASKTMIGCEALIRWTDDELGVVRPDEFIAIAENTGLILELGSYVLKETFRTLNEWNEKGKFLQNFSINISIRQLLHDPFISEVEVLREQYFSNFDSKQNLVFEITEHVFSEDMDKVVNAMNRLKKLGITFSIDDFGTGYSSLSYLQKLPIEEIKIDKTFVSEIFEEQNSENMISTIISIAKNFNFTVVAEGVETQEQFERLKNHHCDTFQGFYFDEALPQSAFEKKYLAI